MLDVVQWLNPEVEPKTEAGAETKKFRYLEPERKIWFPVSSEFPTCHFASQSKGIKFGDYFFDVCCVN